jgi:hypothetical protein
MPALSIRCLQQVHVPLAPGLDLFDGHGGIADAQAIGLPGASGAAQAHFGNECHAARAGAVDAVAARRDGLDPLDANFTNQQATLSPDGVQELRRRPDTAAGRSGTGGSS